MKKHDSFARKLAAIPCAAVAVYTRLTGTDEKGSHRNLSVYLDPMAEDKEAFDEVRTDLPDFSLEFVREAHLYSNMEHFLDGLRGAGES